MYENDVQPEMPQPCDEWHQLIVAAETAGRWAARELALRCSAWHLGRTGSIEVSVEPLISPVAGWLHHTGKAVTETDTGVLVPVSVTAADLFPAEDAASKARSLLVAHAYAGAYCTLLAEEAGVATEIRLAHPAPLPAPGTVAPPELITPPHRTRHLLERAAPAPERRSRPGGLKT